MLQAYTKVDIYQSQIQAISKTFVVLVINTDQHNQGNYRYVQILFL